MGFTFLKESWFSPGKEIAPYLSLNKNGQMFFAVKYGGSPRIRNRKRKDKPAMPIPILVIGSSNTEERKRILSREARRRTGVSKASC